MLRNFLNKDVLEAGCDEAGRGCLAGPVYAAAVILPQNFRHPKLNDSKLLTAEERYALRPVIEKKAIAWSVAMVDNYEIDKINILNASFRAMHLAIRKLKVAPEFLLIDGNRFNQYPGLPHACIIEGDGKFKNIAAASILAKTYRDDHMLELHKEFPHYSWDTNKGYSTERHREGITMFGECKYHRKSFRLLPVPEQQSLFE